jgi:RNA recognition motif-containing protein
MDPPQPTSQSQGSSPSPHTPSTSISTSNTPFLSFPSSTSGQNLETAGRGKEPPTQDKEKKKLLKDRLYIGNLHPTVDEYTLLTLFTKYGTITSLDYLFHKTGPMRGKPRGFAFVEFADQSTTGSYSASQK